MSSFHFYKPSPSGKKTLYSDLFYYFGDITDIQNFNSRFKKVLTCGDPSCVSCVDDFKKMKNKFPFFKDLKESLNRFYINISNSNSGDFNIGMVPGNIDSLSNQSVVRSCMRCSRIQRAASRSSLPASRGTIRGSPIMSPHVILGFNEA